MLITMKQKIQRMDLNQHINLIHWIQRHRMIKMQRIELIQQSSRKK